MYNIGNSSSFEEYIDRKKRNSYCQSSPCIQRLCKHRLHNTSNDENVVSKRGISRTGFKIHQKHKIGLQNTWNQYLNCETSKMDICTGIRYTMYVRIWEKKNLYLSSYRLWSDSLPMKQTESIWKANHDTQHYVLQGCSSQAKTFHIKKGTLQKQVECVRTPFPKGLSWCSAERMKNYDHWK